jgi:invasion protein IalB
MKALPILAALAFTAIAAGANAQEAPAKPQAPQPTFNKEIDGWDIKCFKVADASQCSMVETLVNKKSGQRVLAIRVIYVPAEKRSFVKISVPLNVALENGALLVADTYTSPALPFDTCDQYGCHTVLLPADADLVRKLGSAAKSKMEIVDFDSGKKVPISFPLNGFSNAYQAMVDGSAHGGSSASAEANAVSGEKKK